MDPFSQEIIEKSYMIPPVATSEKINATLYSILSFFQNLHLNTSFFPLPYCHFITTNSDPKIADTEFYSQVKVFLETKDPKFFLLLNSHPDFCESQLDDIDLSILTSIFQKNYFNEFLSTSIYANRFDMFLYCITEIKLPNGKSMFRGKNPDAITWLLNPVHIPRIVFNFHSDDIQRFPFPKQTPISPSSFCASTDKLFIGNQKNSFMIYPLPISHFQTPIQTVQFRNIEEEDKYYSLVWSNDNLYIITEHHLLKYDLSTQAFSSISPHPAYLVPPVISDGYYLYAAKASSRSVVVFQPHQNSFQKVRKIRFDHSVLIGPNSISDYLIPMITDGSSIVFVEQISGEETRQISDEKINVSELLQKPKNSIFRSFSLITGNLIHSTAISNTPPIKSWTPIPYLTRQLIMTDKEILISNQNFQISRWITGNDFFNTDISNICSALGFHYFCGGRVFFDSYSDKIPQLFSVLINEKRYNWFKLIYQIISSSKYEWFPSLEPFLYQYMKNNKSLIEYEFICFFFLTHAKITGASYGLPNPIDTFLTQNYEPYFIWSFPDLFDFKHIALSENAVTALIVYVTIHIDNYPGIAYFIITQYAISLIPREGISQIPPKIITVENCSIDNSRIFNYDKQWDNLDNFSSLSQQLCAIHATLQPALKNAISSKLGSEIFLKSAWKPILEIFVQIIMNIRKYWGKNAFSLVQLFDFGMWDQSEFNSENVEISFLLDCILYFNLAIAFSVPFQKSIIEFTSIEELYSQKFHPLNHRYQDLDHGLLSILDLVFDISDPDIFAYHFFHLRHRILFSTPDESMIYKKRINSIIGNSKSGLSYSSVEKYIFEGDKKELNNLCDSSTLLWFVKLFATRKLKFTQTQQIIFAAYHDQLKSREVDFLSISQRDLDRFVSRFGLPFLLPSNVLISSGIQFSAKQIMTYSLELLISFLDTIIESFDCIYDSTQLLLPLIEPFSNDDNPSLTEFVKPELEPTHYRSSILWLLALKGKEIVDFRSSMKYLILYIRTGSFRFVDTFLSSIEVAILNHDFPLDHFHNSMFEILSTFWGKDENPFIMQRKSLNVFQSIYSIIDHYRNMLKHSTNRFAQYFINKIKNASQSELLAFYSILNDYFDAPKPGVKIEFRSNGIDVIGVITEFNDQTYDAVIKSKSNFKEDDNASNKIYSVATYKLTKYSNIVLKPPEKLKLSPEFFSDFQVFIQLFAHPDFPNEYQNVIKYSSLLTLLKFPFFLQSFLNSINSNPEILNLFQRITQMQWNAKYWPSKSFSDYLYFVSRRFIHFDDFSFLDSPIFENVKSSSIQQNQVNIFEPPNTNPEKNTWNGILATSSQSRTFITSPLHPKCHTSINFFIDSFFYPLTVCGLSPTSNAILVYQTSFNQIKSKIGTFIINLTIDPKISTLRVSIYSTTEEIGNFMFSSSNNFFKIEESNLIFKEEKIISPSIELIYIKLDLSDNSLIPYSIELSSEPFFHSQLSSFEWNGHAIDSFSGRNNSIPYIDSGFYNRISLKIASNNLINRFMMEISAILLMHSDSNIEISKLLTALSIVDPFPLSEISDIKSIHKNRHTKVFQKIIQYYFDNLSKKHFSPNENINGLNEIMKEVEKQFSSINIIEPSNRTALLLNENNSYFSFNCYKITQEKIESYVSFHNKITTTDTPTILVPFDDIYETILEKMVNARHLISLISNYIHISTFDDDNFVESICSSFIHLLSSLSKSFPYFKTIKNLAHYVFPEQPKISSILLKHSLVYSQPNIYFTPLYYHLIGSTKEYTPETLQIYLNNYQNEMIFIQPSSKIVIKSSTNDIELESGQFLIFKNSVVDVTFIEKEKIDIICSPVNLEEIHQIIKELNEWKPIYSHELLNIENNNYLPISIKFTPKCIALMRALLKEMSSLDHDIFEIKCHFVEKNLSESLSIEDIRKITNMKIFTRKKVSYLINHNLQLFTELYPENLLNMNTPKPKLQSNINDPDFQKLFDKLPPYLFSILNQDTSKNNPKFSILYLYHVDDPLFIDYYKEDNLLVIGKFESYEDFLHHLLRKLLDFHEEMFDKH